MTNADISNRLNPLFREIFDDDSICINPGMVAADVEQWDSLNNIRLMVAIEEVFGITFETSELTGLANVGELLETIRGKLG
jgi:acyl carrier protein